MQAVFTSACWEMDAKELLLAVPWNVRSWPRLLWPRAPQRRSYKESEGLATIPCAFQATLRECYRSRVKLWIQCGPWSAFETAYAIVSEDVQQLDWAGFRFRNPTPLWAKMPSNLIEPVLRSGIGTMLKSFHKYSSHFLTPMTAGKLKSTRARFWRSLN